MELIIILSLFIGLSSLIVHIIFIILSLFSKEKWTLIIDYNQLGEGLFELIAIAFFIVLAIFSIILYILI